MSFDLGGALIDPKLSELLERSKSHVMTEEEKEAQRQSWVRGEMGMGTDLDEAQYWENLERRRT